MLATILLSSCGDNEHPIIPPSPAPDALLQNLEFVNLPTPYYHFEYDSQRKVVAASVASGMMMYAASYADGRMSELRNNTAVNKDRLKYGYDGAGRISTIEFEDIDGVVYAMLTFEYDGRTLRGMQRKQRVGTDFVVDRTVTLSYNADGNLFELAEQVEATANRPASSSIDRFERFDDKINVDGFSLLHRDAFDHLVLLPGVRLQKGNPQRLTHISDPLSYVIDYTYQYDDEGRPRTKNGDAVVTGGANTGRRFLTQSRFTYYER